MIAWLGDNQIWFFATPIALLPLDILVTHLFLSELRLRHPVEWASLGRLKVFTPIETTRQEWAWSAFLLRRKYAKLGNRRLTRLGDAVSLLFLVTFAAWGIWFFTGHGWHWSASTKPPPNVLF
jgi:hypothetical protein